MTLSPLQDSLLILTTLSLSINEHYKILDKIHDQEKSKTVYAAVSAMILLQVCSFRDEWDRLLGINEERDRLVNVRTKSRFFIKRIDQWSDLRNVRNTFIAHSFRDDGKNRLMVPYERELNMPNKFPDYIMMAGCIDFITIIVHREFLKELVEATTLFKATRKIPPIKAGINSEKEARAELKSIAENSDLEWLK